jgi:hypothetical protein
VGEDVENDVWGEETKPDKNPSANKVSDSPVTVPQKRRVCLQEAYFPPNYTNDDSTDSMPECDYEDDDDDSVFTIEYLVDQTCSTAQTSSCEM